jgi:hypothetical protein
MLNLSLRARMNGHFRARSVNRDAKADYSRTESVYRTIEEALKNTEAEHFGLTARVQDVLARGAISLGNGTDEYLTREPADTIIQNQFDREIASGQHRLEQLSLQISAFKFLSVALMSRFPDFIPRSEENRNRQRSALSRHSGS